MNLEQACKFANRLGSQVRVVVEDDAPVFTFTTREGELIETDCGRTMKAELRTRGYLH